jgi:hypothetical protein
MRTPTIKTRDHTARLMQSISNVLPTLYALIKSVEGPLNDGRKGKLAAGRTVFQIQSISYDSQRLHFHDCELFRKDYVQAVPYSVISRVRAVEIGTSCGHYRKFLTRGKEFGDPNNLSRSNAPRSLPCDKQVPREAIPANRRHPPKILTEFGIDVH